MKKVLSVLFAVLVLASCTKKDDDKDPIIGEWEQVSETDNGVAVVLTSCDLSEKIEFLADGSAIIEDKDEVSGSCVLNPLPTGFVAKWAKISTNQYKLIIENNGTVAFEQELTAEFSNNNNTLKTTATEQDGDVTVSILNRK